MPHSKERPFIYRDIENPRERGKKKKPDPPREVTIDILNPDDDEPDAHDTIDVKNGTELMPSL